LTVSEVKGKVKGKVNKSLLTSACKNGKLLLTHFKKELQKWQKA
jgi:hypothetical protein